MHPTSLGVTWPARGRSLRVRSTRGAQLRNLSWDKLSATDFEQFIYDLLLTLGFTELSWRKGTGLVGGSPDQGRDIECVWQRPDIDGDSIRERWFVECKHHTAGVPPQQIQGALSWAQAANPDCLAIAVSGFLSNPCKNYLKEYRAERTPPFRIKVWERPDLEGLAAGDVSLLTKYGLADITSHMDLVHPVHAMFLHDKPYSDLATLFSLLDAFDKEDLDVIIGFLPFDLINPRFRDPLSGRETLAELLIDDISYEAFKKKCRDLARHMPESFLVRAIVADMLSFLLLFGDSTRLESTIANNRALATTFGQMKESMPDHSRDLADLISKTLDLIERLPSQTKRCHSLYNRVCDEVVRRLYVT